MNSRPDIARHQSGVILLEALLAILIFSLGILALVGLQAAAVKQSADAKYRTEAALLTNEVIGQMWVSDRTTAVLEANFESPGGAAYNNWLARVGGVLPVAPVANVAGANCPTPAPTITIDPAGIATAGTATVTVFWRAPNEPLDVNCLPAPHSYVAIAQIR